MSILKRYLIFEISSFWREKSNSSKYKRKRNIFLAYFSLFFFPTQNLESFLDMKSWVSNMVPRKYEGTLHVNHRFSTQNLESDDLLTMDQDLKHIPRPGICRGDFAPTIYVVFKSHTSVSRGWRSWYQRVLAHLPFMDIL